MNEETEISALRSWNIEMDSYLIYKVLSEIEKDNDKGILFRKLSSESYTQSEIWKKKLAPQSDLWTYKASIQIRIISCLLKFFGPRYVLHFLPATKVRGLSVYRIPETGHYKGLNADEKVHSKIKSGSNLRAAIFGINDGLVSNASLVFAMVGAGTDNRTIIIAGISGLLAGSFSMATGEYISVKSQRELYENQINIEKTELAEFPEEEAKELSLIYQAKGVDKVTADKVSESLINDPEKALDTLIREELGLNPHELGSAMGASLSSFISFSLGAIIPILPYLFLQTPKALIIAISLSSIALFSIGVIISFLTGKSPIKNGLRMCILGWLAGATTYIIGYYLGMVAG